jgi:hypothetical protein
LDYSVTLFQREGVKRSHPIPTSHGPGGTYAWLRPRQAVGPIAGAYPTLKVLPGDSLAQPSPARPEHQTPTVRPAQGGSVRGRSTGLRPVCRLSANKRWPDSAYSARQTLGLDHGVSVLTEVRFMTPVNRAGRALAGLRLGVYEYGRRPGNGSARTAGGLRSC